MHRCGLLVRKFSANCQHKHVSRTGKCGGRNCRQHRQTHKILTRFHGHDDLSHKRWGVEVEIARRGLRRRRTPCPLTLLSEARTRRTRIKKATGRGRGQNKQKRRRVEKDNKGNKSRISVNVGRHACLRATSVSLSVQRAPKRSWAAAPPGTVNGPLCRSVATQFVCVRSAA